MAQGIAQIKQNPLINLPTKAKADPEEAQNSAGNISFVKHFFYIILSIVLSFGIFQLEKEINLSKAAQLEETSINLTVEGNNRVEYFREGSTINEKFLKKIEVQEGDIIQSKSSSNVTLHFTNESVIRLDENTDIEIKKLQYAEHTFELELLKGQIWVNNQHNSTKLKIRSSGLLVEPQQAILNIIRTGSTVDIHLIKHQANVHFFDEDNQELNNLYVAEGNSISVKLNKLEPVLERLFYSKLTKEFQYTLFNPDLEKNDPWFKQNISKDQKLSDQIQSRELDKIEQHGLTYGSIRSISYVLNSEFNENVKSALTLAQDKKDQLFVNILFSHVDDAMYLAEEGRIDEALERLKFFASKKDEKLFRDAIKVQTLKDELAKRINQLVFVSPSDDLYKVKEFLLRQRLYLVDNEAEGFSQFLGYYLDDVYDAAALNLKATQEILENYYQTVFKILDSNSNLSKEYSQHLQAQNHLIHNLFLRYPSFYKNEFLTQKAQLENKFLATISDNSIKDEERQHLISQKIDLLKRLQFFFFEEKISITDARNTVNALSRDIQRLLPSNNADVAIEELFEKQLQNFNIFLNYLNNEEFVNSNQYSSHIERFEAYKKAAQETQTIKDIQDNFFDNSGPTQEDLTVSKEDIIRQVKKDFAAIGATNLNFDGNLKDGDINVGIKSATLDGYTITGNYNRDKELISDVYVGGNLIIESAVKLENLPSIIDKTFSSLHESSTSETETNTDIEKPLSKKEKLLKLLFKQKLGDAGIIITEEQIDIVDADNSSFEAIGLEISGYPEAVYSFKVIENADEASDIEILSLKHQVKVNENVKLTELEADVKAAYEQYLLQIKKAESEGNTVQTPQKTKVKKPNTAN